MSYEKNRNDENNKSRKTHSNYFQTEFSISFNKKKEDKSCSSSSSQSVYDEKIDGNQQKQVKKRNISVQVGRNIIGQEEMPKERKKWIRPPLVGQASTSTDVIIPVPQELGSDSDEEIIETSHPTVEPTNFASRSDYRNRKDYISEKPPEGGAVDNEISPITNQSEYVKSAASPTSSVTSSRPLEWDSGADVGYFQFYSGQSNEAELSTLERLALQRGSASLLTRSDPEGTTCSSVKPNAPPIGRPTAESTPNNTLSKKKDNSTEKSNYPLFPEVIIKEHQVSDSDIETNKPPEAAVKKSNSLEVVGEIKTDVRPATFPRSQSQTNVVFNINPQLQKILANTKSNSSSSVATVVTGRKKITNNSPESEVSTGDRVNSFEYLPGHIYENKTNDIPLIEGQHFKDDVERGVQLLADFVKGSNANNTLLRKKLLQCVVEGLISAEYLSDREWSPILKRCVTRRSHNRDISGESSTVDDHHSRRTDKESSMGPSPAPSNHTSNVSSQNSTSETSKTSDPLFRVTARKTEVQKLSNHEDAVNLPKSKPLAKSSDSSKISSSDWKQPFTKSEKMFEAKKAADVKAPINGRLIQYLYSERENQIDWIKKEINHLSNLKKLLERHENLRKNFATLKKKKVRVLSADAVKSSRPNKKTNELNSGIQSEPVMGGFQRGCKERFDNNGTTESDYNSHNYDTDRGDGIIRRNASTDTRDIKIINGWEAPEKKKSFAYTIIFEPEKEKENVDHRGGNGERILEEKPVIDRETLMKISRHKIKEQFSKLSLQDELLSKRPDYVARAEGRRQIVAELTALRELRQKHKTNVLAAAVSDTSQPIPPPPLAIKRVVSQKQMRSLTEKKYKKTFEVQQKKQDLKRKEDYRTNRLMADVFKKKLQKRTLRGETDLSNSINVIS
ncbi:hypothetical protein O3M35_012491 [Rhynocoris fuscipes]|uniref:ALMS motif domain-containing protein n=1 Tax=Rhynocoris fuscipes TaxID=488301 RepID=A0AAW1CZ04_9HEMI